MLVSRKFQRLLWLAVFFIITFGAVAFAAQADAPHYRIGAGDLLNIYVWKEAELTQDVTVMSDGRISFPLIGEIMAEGETVAGLKDVIAKKLASYITAPEVTVIVKEARSRRVYTVGKVLRPGPYVLEPNMTVLQSLSAAGGFAEWADTKNILIIRRKGNKEVQFRFNYNQFISGDRLEQNILLEPGDTVVVP